MTNSSPNLFEEFYKSLKALNDRLEENSISSGDVSINLMETIELGEKIRNLPNITLYEQKQLDTIHHNLGNLMRTSLAKQFNLPAKIKDSKVEVGMLATEIPSKSLPVKHALEEFCYTPSSSGFVGVCGMDAILKKIRARFILPLRQPQLFSAPMARRNLLLYGPPGCGKTQLVHALSVELNAKLYCFTPANLMSKYVGDTEKIIRKTFEVLRQRNEVSLLFIDEIDAFCCTRSGSEGEYNRRIKIEFMIQLAVDAPKSKLIVVAATNVPWDIDNAVVRRFSQQLHLGLPEKAQRSALLQFYLDDAAPEGPYANTELWEHIVDITEGFSSSDLKELVCCAMHIPIEELLEVTSWVMRDGKFIPNDLKDNAGIISVVYDLPHGMVKCRPLEILDLINAMADVPRTISKAEITKFQTYRLRQNRVVKEQ